MNSPSRPKFPGHPLEPAFLLALILPPLVQSMAVLLGPGNASVGSLSGIMSPRLSAILLQGALAAALLARSRSLLLLAGTPVSEGRRAGGIAGGPGRIAATLAVAALLLASSILWDWLARLCGSASLTLGEGGGMAAPSLPLLLAHTAVAAFYEEMVYRWYGPVLLGQLLGRPRFPCLWPELVLVIVFALSHSSGGWPGVGNALVAGAILRACALLTRTPFTGLAAHLIYNLIQLFLLLK